ncbi:MAG TPA: TRAP transporter small permease [Xanthobacteraceae bacterium]|nr:TRAP transporter small permease [Xanthobacteraceae bacterium]
MPLLTTLVRVFDQALRALAAIAITAMALTVLAGVVSRALNDPLAWTDEAARFLMIWVATLGWVLATRSRAHIRIRFFRDLLPPRAWGLAEIIINAAIVLFGLLLATYGVELVRRNLDVEATSMPLSMAWLYLPLLVGGLATTLQAIAQVTEVVLRLRAGLHPSGEAPQ